MTEKLSSTPLGRWIFEWLAHQRSLGRDYGSAEWILKHLQRFVSHACTLWILTKPASISGAIPSGIWLPRHVGVDNSSSASSAFIVSARSLIASSRTPYTSSGCALTEDQ
jgi:hypothetical protein